MLPSAPVDMVLNHGTYCASACAAVLADKGSRTALRRYPTADNGELRRALAEDAGAKPENIVIANGSGPLLKSIIPLVVEREIRRSPLRMALHLLGRTAYPVITTDLTYSKVPEGSVRLGLRVDLLPLDPAQGFRLDVAALERRLTRGDGLVYLANPNNPTGNLLIRRRELVPLLEKFRGSYFLIDEAYVHYLDESEDTRMGDLVRAHPNLIVLRSFSFAYGLASVRMGYATCAPELVKALDRKTTPHLVGQLASELVLASLGDRAHLPFVRAETRQQREAIIAGLRALPHLEVYPSETNFVLVRATGPWTGPRVHDALLARGVKVKIFEPFQGQDFTPYFRVTVGLAQENGYFLAQLGEVLGAQPTSKALEIQAVEASAEGNRADPGVLGFAGAPDCAKNAGPRAHNSVG